MSSGGYTFGDSALAATRLALLAEVFDQTTAGFLGGFRAMRPRLVVDLGCGPGFTTTLLRDLLSPERVVAIDSSPAFVNEAARRLGASAEVLAADVMDLPDAITEVDLLFARFVLTHLSHPAAAVEEWVRRLAPGGVVALEEVESITTDEPVVGAYLDLQRWMLTANDNLLEVGPVIEQAAQQRGWTFRSTIVSLTPPTPMVARMFAMNFETLRARPAVLENVSSVELDGIAHGLAAVSTSQTAAPTTWRLRQLSITNSWRNM